MRGCHSSKGAKGASDKAIQKWMRAVLAVTTHSHLRGSHCKEGEDQERTKHATHGNCTGWAILVTGARGTRKCLAELLSAERSPADTALTDPSANSQPRSTQAHAAHWHSVVVEAWRRLDRARRRHRKCFTFLSLLSAAPVCESVLTCRQQRRNYSITRSLGQR